MTEYITTKDTAKLVRAALKSAFPGVKFSVRMSTGTASAWMNVSWADGPTTREVDAITGHFEGRKFNGSTDGYDTADKVLVASENGQMPREVVYVCDGINSHRNYTAEGYKVAQRLITTDSDRKDLVIFTDEGEPVRGVDLPSDLYVAGHFHDYIYNPENIAAAILHHVNITAAAYDEALEHDYIAAPGTEGDRTGPLVCEFCGMSAECADDEVHGCVPHPARDLSRKN